MGWWRTMLAMRLLLPSRLNTALLNKRYYRLLSTGGSLNLLRLCSLNSCGVCRAEVSTQRQQRVI